MPTLNYGSTTATWMSHGNWQTSKPRNKAGPRTTSPFSNPTQVRRPSSDPQLPWGRSPVCIVATSFGSFNDEPDFFTESKGEVLHKPGEFLEDSLDRQHANRHAIVWPAVELRKV